MAHTKAILILINRHSSSMTIKCHIREYKRPLLIPLIITVNIIIIIIPASKHIMLLVTQFH